MKLWMCTGDPGGPVGPGMPLKPGGPYRGERAERKYQSCHVALASEADGAGGEISNS